MVAKAVKHANADFYSALQAATAQQLRRQALQNVGLYAGAGLTAGAGARGLVGLMQLVNRNVGSPPSAGAAPVAIDLPVKPKQPAAPKAKKKTPTTKTSGVSADFLRGDYAQSLSGIPWYVPAAVGGTLAGGYGGWSAMDYLMDKRRKGDLDAELAQAKKEYEDVLHEQAGGNKSASAGTLARDLDELYTEFSKKADWATDLAGQGTGLYGMYAGATGGLGAYLAYNWAKKRQRKAIVEKALKERRRRQFAEQPAAVYGRPAVSTETPQDVPESMKTAPQQEAYEGLDL